jgi:DNA-binding CsgD family transcriptional regulator
VAYVLPLSLCTTRAAFNPGTAAVFVSTQISASSPPEAVLAALFDLTLAEARVLLAVTGNNHRQALPKKLAVSKNTMKTHVSCIYKKTQTKNLAELVRLIAKVMPPTRV